MATIPPLIRAKLETVEACLKLIERLMNEGDRDVRKAVAWALREVSKKIQKLFITFYRGI